MPALLVRAVGWPLPSRLPTLDQLRDTLGGSTVDDGTIIKALAVVCWVAWMQVVASAFVEASAWVRGTVSRPVPLGGLVQPTVRRLVVSVAIVLAGFRSAAPAPPPPATVAPVSAALIKSSSQVDFADAAPILESAPQVAARPAGTVTVGDKDSLWRLAKRHLGDPMRWRELWELNRDRTFPDGRTFWNSNLIQPGWTLTCPPDAVGLDPVPEEAPAAGTTAAPLPATPEPPAQPEVTPSVPGQPLPPAATMPPAPHTAVPAAEDRVAGAESRPAASDHSDHGLPVAVITGSLLAAGFVALLDRLRRIQLRRRLPGRAPATVPAGEVSETRLRCAADGAPAERLDLALRALAGCLTTGETPLPGVALVSVGPQAVEILLSEPTDAKPGPFEVSADGRAWTLASTAAPGEVERVAAGQASPSPALVTVGAIDDRQVLIDLEASPRVLVTGDRRTASRTVRSMALEMITSSWADDIEVIVFGERDASLDRLERATVTADLAVVVEHLERAASTVAPDLEAAGATSTFTCRVHNPGDPWTPTVLLVPEPLSEEDLRRLFDTAAPGRGVAVVAHGSAGVPADTELRVEPGSVTLLPVGLRMQPASLPDELLDGVDELLAVALSDEPGDDLLTVCTRDVSSNGLGRWPPLATQAPGVLVSVLGPVDVRGGERPIARRRSLELVVYLALHPEGVDEGRLRAVLWPESNPSRENFNQTVSRARQPLGHASDGTLHLPRLTNEESARYHLGSEVASDAALLEAVYVVARREASEARIEHLASMLGMIRGIPFEGTKGGWQWTFTEGHAARLASLAADTAHLVAQWLLERGDVQRALWATSQGLRAAPGDEILYRDRMQAHDQAGNRSGVEAVMEELLRTVDDGEPYDSVHPDTVAYYEELTQGVRRSG
ncbi:MAG: hypothetical protein ACRD03_12275 [Acidimicrobiales bacterium]